MQKLRILQVAPYYFPELKFGGPAMKMYSLARGLNGHDHLVEAVTFHSEDRAASRPRQCDSVRVWYLPWFGWGARQFVRSPGRLRELIQGSDIIHAFGIYNFLTPLAARWSRRLGKPFVLEPLGAYKPQARNIVAKKLYNAFFTQAMLRGARAIIANSSAEQADLAGAVPPRKLFLRGNGIDVGVFETKPPRQDARAFFNLPERVVAYLFMGRLSPIKNLEMLIDSFADAAVPDARLLLVGPQEEEQYVAQLRRVVRDRGLDSRIEFVGPLYGEQKLAAYAAADVFVLPSISESYGNAAAEAVAAGLPVLLTNTCGIAPLIDGRAGMAVECSQSALAEGVKHLSIPANRHNYLANRAQQVARLGWEEPVEQQVAIYQKVLADRGGSP